jgi:hypothetical protein
MCTCLVYCYPDLTLGYVIIIIIITGRDSSVGIATSYGWTVRGSNPSGGKIFRTRPDRPWGPTCLLHNGYRDSLPGVKRPARGVDHPPHLAPRLKREQSYTSTPHWAFVACSRVNFTFTFYWQALLQRWTHLFRTNYLPASRFIATLLTVKLHEQVRLVCAIMTVQTPNM